MCSCRHLSSFYFILEAGKYPRAGMLPHKVSIGHKTPSKSGECVGPYTVRFDKVGMLVICCTDETGKTVSTHTTSCHARFVDKPRTHLLDKPAGSTLTIDIERRGSRVLVTSAY